MIVRLWSGRTRRSDGDAYEAFLIDRAAPDYKSIPGCKRVVFTRRDEGEISCFVLITYWESPAAVEAFAGPDSTNAKYYPEDDRFLLEKDMRSHNHVVFFES